MPETTTRQLFFCTAFVVALAAPALVGHARAQGQSQAPAAAPADVGGTYQCKPNPDPCLWSGQSATISQSGDKLTIKGADGAIADAGLTSPTTISAAATFNSIGIIRPDHSIDWSDGTTWSKQ
ncbi:MAG: hypothetical protein WBF58_12190 [Xanthobacteraceae bacterium]